MSTPINSQQLNESLDRLHVYAPYVLVNQDKGLVAWYENLDTAVYHQRTQGGVVINTTTADPDYLRRALLAARANM